jgi:quinol monooxygenase YgiN
MIIVSGRIYVEPSDRNAFLARSLDAVVLARRASGCLDFVVAEDPIEPNRVNVYEEWQSDAKLEAFRRGGPGAEIASMIVRVEVRRHDIASSRSA